MDFHLTSCFRSGKDPVKQVVARLKEQESVKLNKKKVDDITCKSPDNVHILRLNDRWTPVEILQKTDNSFEVLAFDDNQDFFDKPCRSRDILNFQVSDGVKMTLESDLVNVSEKIRAMKLEDRETFILAINHDDEK